MSKEGQDSKPTKRVDYEESTKEVPWFHMAGFSWIHSETLQSWQKNSWCFCALASSQRLLAQIYIITTTYQYVLSSFLFQFVLRTKVLKKGERSQRKRANSCSNWNIYLWTRAASFLKFYKIINLYIWLFIFFLVSLVWKGRTECVKTFNSLWYEKAGQLIILSYNTS